MEDVGNMKKSRQLTMAAGIMGMQLNNQTAEIILDLMDLIRDKGDGVTIGDVNKVVAGMQEKARAEQVAQQMAQQMMVKK